MTEGAEVEGRFSEGLLGAPAIRLEDAQLQEIDVGRSSGLAAAVR